MAELCENFVDDNDVEDDKLVVNAEKEKEECVGDLQTIATTKSDDNCNNLMEINVDKKAEKMLKSDDDDDNGGGNSDCSVKEDSKSSVYECRKSTQLPKKLRDRLKKELPEVLDIINSLHSYIEKQKRKLKKLKNKLKKKCKTCDKSVQTDVNNKSVNSKQVEVKGEEKPKTIAEEITEAAQQAIQNSGFVYEETSGLYYDYNTGYYYNAEYGLYYEAKTGTYMTYNAENQTYEFHSQVEVPSSSTALKHKSNKYKSPSNAKRKSKIDGNEQDVKRTKKSQKIHIQKEIIDLEEGECSDADSYNDEVLEIYSSENEADEDNDDIANQYPPCMRIIVEESNVAGMKPGSLHIITYEGGTIGREGKHDILIPDINVSKHHLKILFDKETKEFKAIDLGSRNGTILNGKRMSSSKQESDALQVLHGSKIQLSSVILLCHVHNGNQTCGHCEPGLIQKPEEKAVLPHYNKNREHKKELLKLKKKFAVNFDEDVNKKVGPGYQDRAQVRRDTIGSQNHNEKTEVASVHENISSQNKGFKMLSKLGWSEGQTLGKDSNKGLLEPIPLVGNVGTAGLGSGGVSDVVPTSTTACNVSGNALKLASFKERLMKITQERFDKALVCDSLIPPNTEEEITKY